MNILFVNIFFPNPFGFPLKIFKETLGRNGLNLSCTQPPPYQLKLTLKSTYCKIPILTIDSLVVRQEGEYQNGGNKKTKHAKFSEKRALLLPMNCLSVFDHFVGLALEGLKFLKFTTDHNVFENSFVKQQRSSNFSSALIFKSTGSLQTLASRYSSSFMHCFLKLWVTRSFIRWKFIYWKLKIQNFKRYLTEPKRLPLSVFFR